MSDVTTLPPVRPAGRRRPRPAPAGGGAAGGTAAGGTAAGGVRAGGVMAGGVMAGGVMAGGGQRTAARPGTRLALPLAPGTPGRPRPGLPAPRQPGLRRPGLRYQGSRQPAGPTRAAGHESRTPFVFLVLGLLSGALVSLLLINTVLATGSVRITSLQQADIQLARQQQALRAQIASEQTPGSLFRHARRLGMTQPRLTHFLDLRKGQIISQPRRVPDVIVYPPGYTP
jgi:hypothetical protein